MRDQKAYNIAVDLLVAAGQEETWLPVVGFVGTYMVSSMGRVKSLKRARVLNDRILVPTTDGEHYLTVGLSDKANGRRQRTHSIHVLVADAFIPNPDGLKDINHKNADKTDNRLVNLERCTRSENMKHAVKLGLGRYGQPGWKVQDRIKGALNTVRMEVSSGSVGNSSVKGISQTGRYL
jgi:hypothetical protein